MPEAELRPYAGLDPDTVLDAVEAAGWEPDGRLLALNSFENRVYQAGLEDGGFVVVKFYRPGRWSDAAILEEHAFALELAAAELPVVAPLACGDTTLARHAGFRFAVFPRRGGRAPELQSAEHLAWMGRLLARLHNVGASGRFAHRPRLDRRRMVTGPVAAVRRSGLLPDHLEAAYAAATAALEHALAPLDDALDAGGVRLHGDCHAGNVLWTDAGPHFVDLDDCCTGPAVQDLWMLAPDARALDLLLEGYGQFRDLAPGELALIPALRVMRQVHHAGWIAARWDDPAFPQAFPFAAEARWWQEHVGDLEAALETL